ncbi:Hypothetical predicted protein [Cloeon dipterum]|nr:Hypothetical predicted protein [Cloeon dipterum]
MADDGNMSERINCELHNMLNSVKSIIGYCEDTMKKKLQTSKHHQAKCEAKSRRGWIFHADPSSSSTSSSARIEEAQKLHRSEEETPIDIKRYLGSELSLIRGQKSDDPAAAPPKHDEPKPGYSKAEMAEEPLKMLREMRKLEKMIRNAIISWNQNSHDATIQKAKSDFKLK